MQLAGGAVGGDHFWECRQDATFVAWISSKASIGQGTEEAAAIACSRLEGPENISVGHVLEFRYGWVHDA